MNKEQKMLNKALYLATLHHRYQTNLAGEPYIFHCIRVAAKFKDPFYKTIALLHDTIEDTTLTIEDLHEEGFSLLKVTIINSLTRKKDEPYMEYIERLSFFSKAIEIKLADLEDNMNTYRLKKWDEKASKRIERYMKARDFLQERYKERV